MAKGTLAKTVNASSDTATLYVAQCVILDNVSIPFSGTAGTQAFMFPDLLGTSYSQAPRYRALDQIVFSTRGCRLCPWYSMSHLASS